jgi:F0F1-type ATP synthase assembly protein I
VPQRQPTVWDLVTLGTTTVACLVGGLVVGLLVDQHLHTVPVYTLVGLGVGIVGAALITYVRVRKYLNS